MEKLARNVRNYESLHLESHGLTNSLMILMIFNKYWNKLLLQILPKISKGCSDLQLRHNFSILIAPHSSSNQTATFQTLHHQQPITVHTSADFQCTLARNTIIIAALNSVSKSTRWKPSAHVQKSPHSKKIKTLVAEVRCCELITLSMAIGEGPPVVRTMGTSDQKNLITRWTWDFYKLQLF